MSDEINNLHTAIRRYCIDHYSYWMEKYSELAATGKNRSGNGYTDEALSMFPRYMLLNSILVEIERYRPEEFDTVDEAKRFFHIVVAETQSESTQPHERSIERKAIDEERDAICKFIGGLTNEDLARVEPLFYRRVLSDEESNFIWERLRSRWEITEHYWYPLTLHKRDDIEAFQDTYFEKEFGSKKLQKILRNRGVEKVFEIREYGASYELELSVFEPYYNGAEGYWCDSKNDWIIYASHESSITIGGWLLSEVQALWSNWKERVWTTPFFN
ncbi:MAG TPA: hypothetical protein VF648_03075 [Pyrinomonadaceae bacterium]